MDIMDNNDNTGIIYRIYNTITKKSYIGKTSKSFDERYYKGDFIISTTSEKLRNDYKLFGEQYFSHEIVERTSLYTDLDNKEVLYINLYNYLFGTYNTQMSYGKFNKLNNHKMTYYNISDLILYNDFTFHKDYIEKNYTNDFNEKIYSKDLSIYKCDNNKYIYLVPYKIYHRYSFSQFKEPIPLNTYFNILGITETIQENLFYKNDKQINDIDKLLLNIINKEYGDVEKYRYKHIYNNNYCNSLKDRI